LQIQSNLNQIGFKSFALIRNKGQLCVRIAGPSWTQKFSSFSISLWKQQQQQQHEHEFYAVYMQYVCKTFGSA
jgi:hypothetical protein